MNGCWTSRLSIGLFDVDAECVEPEPSKLKRVTPTCNAFNHPQHEKYKEKEYCLIFQMRCDGRMWRTAVNERCRNVACNKIEWSLPQSNYCWQSRVPLPMCWSVRSPPNWTFSAWSWFVEWSRPMAMTTTAAPAVLAKFVRIVSVAAMWSVVWDRHPSEKRHPTRQIQ